ncbi:unnamed protein product [Callosobruchus maculatus]|uniref:Uncharacterized protein n=1 Tax=Callosobruchus maculatus TaxID=64391 RepID=A0A653D458_CALMS|nr:unnamed protein product [Callosobruchus maculatus]
MKLIRVHSNKQRNRGKVIPKNLFYEYNITNGRETNLTTTPSKPTKFWKVQFSSLPKTTRIFCVSLLAAIVGTVIACVVIFTKKSGTPPDPDYFGDSLGNHPVYYRDTWGKHGCHKEVKGGFADPLK